MTRGPIITTCQKIMAPAASYLVTVLSQLSLPCHIPNSTPEEVSSAKGSAYNLLLSQFRRGIGCLGMKVAVEEKLRRIMLIWSNKREPNAAAHNGTSNHRRCFNTNTPRWYSNERNEVQYDAFYRYRTKYDNFHSDENGNNEDF